ncbi:MAG: putative ABC transporter permease [Flavobacteriales bacterium]|nr:putative ABC transporter permease [Flavobacteriales bacterium]
MKTHKVGISERFISFALYGGLGITTEVFFTAISDLINSGNFDDLSLKGQSYIWMFPIYGLAAILFPLAFSVLKKWNRMLRYIIYGAGILLVELITGFLLEQFTGRCPWEYQTGWHFGGYIRFDYLPLWMLFGALIEEFHHFNKRIGLVQ